MTVTLSAVKLRQLRRVVLALHHPWRRAEAMTLPVLVSQSQVVGGKPVTRLPVPTRDHRQGDIQLGLRDCRRKGCSVLWSLGA